MTDSPSEIHLLDVGQGDCLVAINGATREAVVIDCPDQAAANKVVNLLRLADVRLAAAVITHWDTDHYGGIAKIAQQIAPRSLYYNHDTLVPAPGERKSRIRSALLNILDLPDAERILHPLRAGDKFQIGEIKVRCFAPTHFEVSTAIARGQRNVASAVTLIEVTGTRILTGADATGAVWQRLLNEESDLKADYFRWPHHGAQIHGDSTASIASEILNAVRPRFTFISTGARNIHGHPDWDVIQLLRGAGIHVLCSQVTPGCFGFRDRRARLSADGRAQLDLLNGHHACAGDILLTINDQGAVSMTPSVTTHFSRLTELPAPMCQASGDARIGTQPAQRAASHSR